MIQINGKKERVQTPTTSTNGKVGVNVRQEVTKRKISSRPKTAPNVKPNILPSQEKYQPVWVKDGVSPELSKSIWYDPALDQNFVLASLYSVDRAASPNQRTQNSNRPMEKDSELQQLSYESSRVSLICNDIEARHVPHATPADDIILTKNMPKRMVESTSLLNSPLHNHQRQQQNHHQVNVRAPINVVNLGSALEDNNDNDFLGTDLSVQIPRAESNDSYYAAVSHPHYHNGSTPFITDDDNFHSSKNHIPPILNKENSEDGNNSIEQHAAQNRFFLDLWLAEHGNTNNQEHLFAQQSSLEASSNALTVDLFAQLERRLAQARWQEQHEEGTITSFSSSKKGKARATINVGFARNAAIAALEVFDLLIAETGDRLPLLKEIKASLFPAIFADYFDVIDSNNDQADDKSTLASEQQPQQEEAKVVDYNHSQFRVTVLERWKQSSDQYAHLHSVHEGLVKDFAYLSSTHQQTVEELSQQKQTCKTLKDNHDKQSIDLKTLKKEHKELNKLHLELKETCSATESKLRELQQSHTTQSKDLKDTKGQLAIMTKKANDLEAKVAEYLAKLEKVNKEANEMRKERRDLRKESTLNKEELKGFKHQSLVDRMQALEAFEDMRMQIYKACQDVNLMEPGSPSVLEEELSTPKARRISQMLQTDANNEGEDDPFALHYADHVNQYNNKILHAQTLLAEEVKRLLVVEANLRHDVSSLQQDVETLKENHTNEVSTMKSNHHEEVNKLHKSSEVVQSSLRQTIHKKTQEIEHLQKTLATRDNTIATLDDELVLLKDEFSTAKETWRELEQTLSARVGMLISDSRLAAAMERMKVTLGRKDLIISGLRSELMSTQQTLNATKLLREQEQAEAVVNLSTAHLLHTQEIAELTDAVDLRLAQEVEDRRWLQEHSLMLMEDLDQNQALKNEHMNKSEQLLSHVMEMEEEVDRKDQLLEELEASLQLLEEQAETNAAVVANAANTANVGVGGTGPHALPLHNRPPSATSRTNSPRRQTHAQHGHRPPSGHTRPSSGNNNNKWWLEKDVKTKSIQTDDNLAQAVLFDGDNYKSVSTDDPASNPGAFAYLADRLKREREKFRKLKVIYAKERKMIDSELNKVKEELATTIAAIPSYIDRHVEHVANLQIIKMMNEEVDQRINSSSGNKNSNVKVEASVTAINVVTDGKLASEDTNILQSNDAIMMTTSNKNDGEMSEQQPMITGASSKVEESSAGSKQLSAVDINMLLRISRRLDKVMQTQALLPSHMANNKRIIIDEDDEDEDNFEDDDQFDDDITSTNAASAPGGKSSILGGGDKPVKKTKGGIIIEYEDNSRMEKRNALRSISVNEKYFNRGSQTADQPSHPPNMIKHAESSRLVFPNRLRSDAAYAEALSKLSPHQLSQPFIGYIRKHEKIYAREIGLMKIALREAKGYFDHLLAEIRQTLLTTTTASKKDKEELVKVEQSLVDHLWMFDPRLFICKVSLNPLEDPVDVAAQTRLISSYNEVVKTEQKLITDGDVIAPGGADRHLILRAVEDLMSDLNGRIGEHGGWRALLYRCDGSMDLDMDITPFDAEDQVEILSEQTRYLQMTLKETDQRHVKVLEDLYEELRLLKENKNNVSGNSNNASGSEGVNTNSNVIVLQQTTITAIHRTLQEAIDMLRYVSSASSSLKQITTSNKDIEKKKKHKLIASSAGMITEKREEESEEELELGELSMASKEIISDYQNSHSTTLPLPDNAESRGRIDSAKKKKKSISNRHSSAAANSVIIPELANLKSNSNKHQLLSLSQSMDYIPISSKFTLPGSTSIIGAISISGGSSKKRPWTSSSWRQFQQNSHFQSEESVLKMQGMRNNQLPAVLQAGSPSFAMNRSRSMLPPSSSTMGRGRSPSPADMNSVLQEKEMTVSLIVGDNSGSTMKVRRHQLDPHMSEETRLKFQLQTIHQLCKQLLPMLPPSSTPSQRAKTINGLAMGEQGFEDSEEEDEDQDGAEEDGDKIGASSNNVVTITKVIDKHVHHAKEVDASSAAVLGIGEAALDDLDVNLLAITASSHHELLSARAPTSLLESPDSKLEGEETRDNEDDPVKKHQQSLQQHKKQRLYEELFSRLWAGSSPHQRFSSEVANYANALLERYDKAVDDAQRIQNKLQALQETHHALPQYEDNKWMRLPKQVSPQLDQKAGDEVRKEQSKLHYENKLYKRILNHIQEADALNQQQANDKLQVNKLVTHKLPRLPKPSSSPSAIAKKKKVVVKREQPTTTAVPITNDEIETHGVLASAVVQEEVITIENTEVGTQEVRAENQEVEEKELPSLLEEEQSMSSDHVRFAAAARVPVLTNGGTFVIDDSFATMSSPAAIAIAPADYPIDTKEGEVHAFVEDPPSWVSAESSQLLEHYPAHHHELSRSLSNLSHQDLSNLSPPVAVLKKKESNARSVHK